MIINRVKTRDQIVIDSLEEALRRAADNGVKRLIVQPTHIMDGFEYTALADKVAEYSRFFEAAAVGKPLLSSEGDFQAVVQALIEETEEYDDGETSALWDTAQRPRPTRYTESCRRCFWQQDRRIIL